MEKGIAGANRGAACRLRGNHRGGNDARMQASGSFGVKEPAFFKISSGRLRRVGWHVASRGGGWGVVGARWRRRRKVASASAGGLVVGARGLRPEDRFARGGVGLAGDGAGGRRFRFGPVDRTLGSEIAWQGGDHGISRRIAASAREQSTGALHSLALAATCQVAWRSPESEKPSRSHGVVDRGARLQRHRTFLAAGQKKPRTAAQLILGEALAGRPRRSPTCRFATEITAWRKRPPSTTG